MLCLKCETNSEWINVALANIDSIIIDHAHCEKKAAVTGMNLINNYPEKIELCFAMADLIEEEVDHFRRVLNILELKGHSFHSGEKDEYAITLFKKLRKEQPYRLMDHLLIAGIIEARSCERLQILAEHIDDNELKEFYTELAETEAGHYMSFVKLAKLYFDEEEVKERLDDLTNYEKEIVENLSNLPLMHG